jgi:hypothetical protein
VQGIVNVGFEFLLLCSFFVLKFVKLFGFDGWVLLFSFFS